MFSSTGMIPIFLLSCVVAAVSSREFTVDYKNDQFLLDGEPFRYVSGSIHYFRVPHELWRDRLQKMRAGGLNVISTYVEWSFHEPQRGQFRFDGDHNLTDFIRIAQEEDLLVVLRQSPFIDAERDMGGFPYWLLRENPKIKLRSTDKSYLGFVSDWYDVLLPMIQPLLYKNGGPIIMLQIENEYGSYDCDIDYLIFLRNLIYKYVGKDVVLFTNDGASHGDLRCGMVPGALETLDMFSLNPKKEFDILREHQPHGPIVVSEFYPGWLDHWQHPHNTRTDLQVSSALDRMLALNASVNFYMYHGGTSFGFGAGANKGGGANVVTYCPTSYDYDAPLSEAGDPTSKYFTIRDIIDHYLPVPPTPVPTPSVKGDYGAVPLKHVTNLIAALPVLSPKPIQSVDPLTFEQLGQSGGYVLYTSLVPGLISSPTVLTIEGLGDRAYVSVDGDFVGILSREVGIVSLPIVAQKDQFIRILIENQGRICAGSGTTEFKGMTKVLLNNEPLQDWTIYPIPMNDTHGLSKTISTLAKMQEDDLLFPFSFPQNSTHLAGEHGGMAFYRGTFVIPDDGDGPLDTFLRLDGWTKGLAFVNDVNLGRYWPTVGPQVTLYVPRTALRPNPDENVIVIFEQENAPCVAQPSKCEIRFVNTPEINAPTPWKT